MSEQYKTTLNRAEIKRIGEKLTKKELCNIYGFNYQFYMNAVSGRNTPSKKMADELESYLNSSSTEVYKMVFESREAETSFHQELPIEETLFDNMVIRLKDTDSIHINEDEIVMLRKSAKINRLTRDINKEKTRIGKQIEELMRKIEQGSLSDEELINVNNNIKELVVEADELGEELEKVTQEVLEEEVNLDYLKEA